MFSFFQKNMALFRNCFRFLVDAVVVLAIIIYIPGVPPYGEFQQFSPLSVPPLEGVLSPKNYALNMIEKLFEHEIIGPECIEMSPTEPGVFYSTLQGGRVVKFEENSSKLVLVAKFGSKVRISVFSQSLLEPPCTSSKSLPV